MRFPKAAAAITLFSSPLGIPAFSPSSLRYSPNTNNGIKTSTHLSAYIQTSENAPRNMEPFGDWATNAGIQRIDGFQVTTEDGLDFSILTNTDIPFGQPILSVPADVVLTASKAKQELMAMSAGGLQEAVDQLNRIGSGLSVPQFYLFLKLLIEFEKQEESLYYAWLDSLPRLYYNAVSMTDFCYECLPPLVFSLSRAERLKFDNFMEALEKVDVLSPMVKGDHDVCKWAFNAVYTRCLGQEGQNQFIIPMADMFNHGTETEVEITLDEQGNAQAVTTKDVPAGSQLRMSYGDPTNPSLLFAKYGFLDKSCPATFCKMMNIKSTPELEDIGYGFSKMLFYKDTGDISDEVWDVVLYAKVLADKPDVRMQFYQAHMNGDADTKAAIHQQFLFQTVTDIKEHVDTFLESLDALSNKAIGKSYEEHPRLPLILSHNEFVKSTFMNVKARLDSMVEQGMAQGMA